MHNTECECGYVGPMEIVAYTNKYEDEVACPVCSASQYITVA